jgi:mutator protein MutT
MIEVAAAVICEDDRYLITLRHADSHCGALWEFPGGKRHPKESLEECLVREIREELGLEIAVEELLEKIAHSYPKRAVLIYFFRCRRIAGEPQALECSEFRWVLPQHLNEYSFPEADARLIARIAHTAATKTSPGA